MGGSSPEKEPGNRHLFQIDTTENRRKIVMPQTLLHSSFGKLRTVVISDSIMANVLARPLARRTAKQVRSFGCRCAQMATASPRRNARASRRASADSLI